MNLFFINSAYRSWYLNIKTIMNKKFTHLADLYWAEQGKNNTSTFVQSVSKRTNANKQWVRKDLTFNYDIADAASEIFFGQLAASIFGKNSAPKTKFNPDRAGIVSRVLGDNLQKNTKLLWFMLEKNTAFSMVAKKSLLDSLAFGVIIGDRDIAARNIIVKREPGSSIAQHVYGIDHEFGVLNPTHVAALDLASLGGFVSKAIRRPKTLFDIVVTNTYKWSHGNGIRDISHVNTDQILNKMCDGISEDHVKLAFRTIAEKIAADDFQMIADIKQHMLKQLNKASIAYPPHIVNNFILPKLDEITSALPKNVMQVLHITGGVATHKRPLSVKPHPDLLDVILEIEAILDIPFACIKFVLNTTLLVIMTIIKGYMKAILDVMSFIIATLNTVLDMIEDTINTIVYAVQTTFAFIGKICKSIVDEIALFVQGIIGLVKDVSLVIKNTVFAVANAIFTFGRTIRDTVAETINATVDLVQNTYKSIKNTVVASINTTVDFVATTYKSSKGYVVATINDTVDYAQQTYKSTKDFVAATTTASVNYVQKTCKSIKDYVVTRVCDNASYIQQTCQNTATTAAVSMRDAAVSMQDRVYYWQETCKTGVNEAVLSVGNNILDMQDACQAGLNKMANTGYAAMNYLQQMYKAKANASNTDGYAATLYNKVITAHAKNTIGR